MVSGLLCDLLFFVVWDDIGLGWDWRFAYIVYFVAGLRGVCLFGLCYFVGVLCYLRYAVGLSVLNAFCC